ncbi:helix-turn-helix domain-containing protein [Lihuaxuella thermophila]|uniref:helix-turn-helix domain-containing protein n=1 Tax=Lihuaxuella thermophila TaxID=1173111 RepID=UPI00111452C0|nr:helix-turn-helix transcriptional regulator [Lihuaxuella thermophila]
MIITENAYRESKKMIASWEEGIRKLQDRWRREGLTQEEIDSLTLAHSHLTMKIQAEIQEYEAIKRGEFDMTCNFENIGQQLVRFRIWKGLSQSELAERLGVTPQQVSKDERNGYARASSEKIRQVLEALGIEVTIQPAWQTASGEK